MNITKLRQHCTAYERGRAEATLEDALAWEELGLGRVFFEDGKPVWHPNTTRDA